MSDITIVMAQFGPQASEFEPGQSSFMEHFPEAQLALYTDGDADGYHGTFVKKVDSIYPKDGPRYGNRSNDYYKVLGLLEADTRFAISIDTDTLIVHEAVRTIIPLVRRFGLCVPCNPRHLVAVDTAIGQDSDHVLDDTLGTGYAVNMTPIAVDLQNCRAVAMLESYLRHMKVNPVRGPLAMWRAMWETGMIGCLLPPQWCVCMADYGCGNEIILHGEAMKRYLRDHTE